MYLGHDDPEPVSPFRVLYEIAVTAGVVILALDVIPKFWS